LSGIRELLLIYLALTVVRPRLGHIEFIARVPDGRQAARRFGIRAAHCRAHGLPGFAGLIGALLVNQLDNGSPLPYTYHVIPHAVRALYDHSGPLQ
jgi:hypothetical protein